MADPVSNMSLRRLGWTLAFIMAGTGCGGGCGSCGSGCFDVDYDCGYYDDYDDWPGDGGPPWDFAIPDGAPADGAFDATIDPLCPGVGDPCTAALGCANPEAVCFEPSRFGGDRVGMGGPDDPIVDHPDGDETFVSTPLFPGGYCTTSWPQDRVTPAQCNVRAEFGADPICGECGKCIDVFGLEDEPTDFVPGFCARRCTPRMNSNECRPGYACVPDLEVCFLGCQSDDECRIERRDTNGVPNIQTPAQCDAEPETCRPLDCDDDMPADPWACFDPRPNFDALVYDTESRDTCDPITSQCMPPFDAEAVAGDPCTEDAQCERWGRCNLEDDGWPGGACTKDRCDIEDNECAVGGVCATVPHVADGPACFQSCTVGGHDASSPESWTMAGSARADCREGYACEWTGRGDGGMANGACVPESYSPDVPEPNIGKPCDVDRDCWSPFGQGLCLRDDGLPEGYCSVRNCFAPWLTAGDAALSLCGDDAICVPFDASEPSAALCAQACTNAEDCAPGLGCQPLGGTIRACWVGCTSSLDCRRGERCTDDGTGPRCVTAG